MSLPRYIVNFDELTDDLKKELLKLIDDKFKNKYPKLDSNNLEALLEDIKELLPSEQYQKLKKKIGELIYTKYEGIQKVEGKLLDVPPIVRENKIEFKFDKDIFITGVHFNQTGWKKQDRYSLEIDKDKIINHATIKEIGEHKYFNTYFKVNANTPISFILENNSGNSRQVILDLEYIEGIDSTIIVPPPQVPTIDDITNDWDVAVVMEWEANTNTDLDLHGIMGDTHVCYRNREENGLYLNFDYTSQNKISKPEIISVKGNKNKTLDIYIHNFNGGKLTQSVTVKIYHHKFYGNKLLKEINVNLENSNGLKAICSIDLNTLEIRKSGGR